MDCYLRRLKQELVRAERAPGARRTAPPRRYLAPAAGPGAGSERVEEGQRGGDGPAEGRACPEGKGREETWSQDLCERDRPEQGTETEQPKPRLKCAQRRRGRHGGHPRRRTAAGTARGAAERAGQEGRGEQGRAAGDRGLSGSWHRLGPPAPPGLAELARLRGQAGPAVCPGLSASREGGWQLEGRGRAPRRRRGAAWQIVSGAAGARPDVWAGRGECGGSLRRPGAQGSEEAPSGTRASPKWGEGCPQSSVRLILTDFIYHPSCTHVPVTFLGPAITRIHTDMHAPPPWPPGPPFSQSDSLPCLCLFLFLLVSLAVDLSSVSLFSPLLSSYFPEPGAPRISTADLDPWLSRFHDSLSRSCKLCTPHPSKLGNCIWGQFGGAGQLAEQVFSLMLPGQGSKALFLSVPFSVCLLRSMVASLGLPLQALFVVTLRWESCPEKCCLGEGQRNLHHVPSHARFPVLPMSVWDGQPQPTHTQF